MDNKPKNVTLTGRVTKDLTGGLTKSGDEYVKVNLATDGEDGGTVWVDAVAYGLTATNLKKVLKKGSKAQFRGLFRVKEFQKNDGSVGVSNNLTIDSAKIVYGGKLITVDEFTTDLPGDTGGDAGKPAETPF